MHHPTRTTEMVGASATTRIPKQRPSRPRTIHGRRIPQGEAVRSLILPKNGFPTIVNRAPVPATSDKLLGARSVPTSAFTLRAKVSRRGARNNRLVLRTPTCTAR
jgi:hypothetical protein